jgi:nucleoid DNA-binding protein
MHKHALIDVLAATTEFNQADAAKAMDALIETVGEKAIGAVLCRKRDQHCEE